MGFFRPANPVVRARSDGRFDLVLDRRVRAVIDDALDGITQLLETPDEPMLARLQPTTYPDDADREAGYRLLAGDELRTSHRAAIETLRTVFDEGTATDEQLWSAIRALNSVRLVTGTLLGIETEDDHPDTELDPADPAYGMWALYELSAFVQHHIVQALAD